LGQDSGDTADGKREADAFLIPPVSGQVNGQEGSDARLHVGEEEIEPI